MKYGTGITVIFCSILDISLQLLIQGKTPSQFHGAFVARGSEVVPQHHGK
jgi:hypothetical protein